VYKKKKLFCEISPLTYNMSVLKNRLMRLLKNILSVEKFALKKQSDPLPILIYEHKSLIRRKLGNSNLEFQENKAVNLSIASPKVSLVLIKPNETFSFWKLVGSCTKRKGYLNGLIISKGETSGGIGGGMCQFTNLIHWLVLHTPMMITEHHHHNGMDLFPDFGRQIPFGTGTSIMHNYLDYRFKNPTNITFQLIVYTTDEYLCGEMRANSAINMKYHIKAENEFFTKEDDSIYRNNEIFRTCIDKATGRVIDSKLIISNHALVMYDEKYIPVVKMVLK